MWIETCNRTKCDRQTEILANFFLRGHEFNLIISIQGIRISNQFHHKLLCFLHSKSIHKISQEFSHRQTYSQLAFTHYLPKNVPCRVDFTFLWLLLEDLFTEQPQNEKKTPIAFWPKSVALNIFHYIHMWTVWYVLRAHTISIFLFSSFFCRINLEEYINKDQTKGEKSVKFNIWRRKKTEQKRNEKKSKRSENRKKYA